MTDENNFNRFLEDSTSVQGFLDLTKNKLSETPDLDLFATDNEDEDDSPTSGAYEDTVSYRPEDGPQLEGFPTFDIANGDEERPAVFGMDDLEGTISRLNDLANASWSSFEHTGDVDNISEAIRYLQFTIQLIPDGHPELPARLNNLGLSFWRRFEHAGEKADITAAIRHQQHAIKLTPDGHDDLPAFLNNLGNSFSSLFEFTGDRDDISEAIKHQRQAVQLTPTGHELPEQLDNLGISFSRLFECTGDMNDISQAIRYQQQAVRLASGELVPRTLNNLGQSFWRRFEHTGDMDDITEAIRLQQQAVQLIKDGWFEAPCLLDSLGISLSSRFERTGDMNDISEAIRYQQQAVQLTPDGDTALPRLLNNLGLSFWRRFERTEDMDDISEAIQHQQHAVQLTVDEHADLPCWLNNLGLSFWSRFGRTENIDDITEGILHQRRAVELAGGGHPDLPCWLDNLGNSLAKRFESTENMEDISEAIRHQQQAVQLTMIPDGHPELPGRLNNLAVSLSIRFEQTGNTDEISQSIQHLQYALQLTPDGHTDRPLWFLNLGNSYACRFDSTGVDGFLQSAVSSYRLSATSSSGPPFLRLAAAKQWASYLQPSCSSTSELLDAHSCIIHLLSLISGFENTVQRRYANLVDTSQLSRAAAAAALSVGHPDRALEWLVEGRCIVWNQINQLRTPIDELRSYDPALADRFYILSRELENTGLRSDSRGIRIHLSMNDKISLENEARMHIKLAQDWEQLLDTIRSIPQFTDFLRPSKCVDIMYGLPEEGPVVIVNIHNDCCDALALISGTDKPIHIPLDFSFQEAERLANGLRGYLLSSGVRSRIGIPDDEDSLHPDIIIELPTVLGLLWSEVVSPILEGLGFSIADSGAKLPRIWWCPTGPLAFLPIHAAGIYHQGKGIPGKCLSEFAVSSSIPTVQVLKASNSVKRYHDAPTGLLMISQPKTPGKKQIPFAKDEIEKIERQLGMLGIPHSTLTDESAMVSRVLKSMEEYSCIHLACHASQHTEAPLKSSIHLHDGPLELTEIMKKKFDHADFAFLSACQTSKGDANLPEEAVHLASGMLAAGYRSVVGTMWSVIDEHGPELAEFFYETMVEDQANGGGPKIDGRGAARALHDARRRLQEKVSSLPYSFLAWVPYIHIGI